MIRSALLIGLASAAVAGAQTMPYEMAFRLTEQAKRLQEKTGFVLDLRMVHSRPEDKRPITVVAESEGEKLPVKLAPNGEFELPPLPEKRRADAVLRHNLEKGDVVLTGSVALHFGKGAKGKLEGKLIDVLHPMVAGFKEHGAEVLAMLAPIAPEFRQARVGIVGLTFPGTAPVKGNATLLRDGEVVATVDLSQPVEVTWKFSEFDPTTHVLAFEGLEVAGSTVLRPMIAGGKELDEAKNAILLVE